MKNRRADVACGGRQFGVALVLRPGQEFLGLVTGQCTALVHDATSEPQAVDRDPPVFVGREVIRRDFRMGAHFFPAAMSIYLKASPTVVIRRLAGRGDEAFAQLLERNVKARRRLFEIYGYDYAVEANYRYVIDTDELTAVQIVEHILARFGLHGRGA